MLFNPCQNVSVYANESEKLLDVDYSKFDKTTTQESADKFFKQALSTSDVKTREKYLKEALAKYYILSNMDKSNPYYCVRLARIYDIQKNDAYAKAYFYRALGLDSKNVSANFYFAEFYNTRKQYKRALEYYNKALMYGMRADASTYKKIGNIYERFGDITRANFYYKESKRLNPRDKNIEDKIHKTTVPPKNK